MLGGVSGGNGFLPGGRMAPGGSHAPQTSKSYIAFALPEAKKQQGTSGGLGNTVTEAGASARAWALERKLGGRGAATRRRDPH
jgi:hypothetical protein